MEYFLHMHGIDEGISFVLPAGVTVYHLTKRGHVIYRHHCAVVASALGGGLPVPVKQFAERFGPGDDCPDIDLTFGNRRDLHNNSVETMGIFDRDGYPRRSKIELDEGVYTPEGHAARFEGSLVVPKYFVTGRLNERLSLEQLVSAFGEGTYYMMSCRWSLAAPPFDTMRMLAIFTGCFGDKRWSQADIDAMGKPARNLEMHLWYDVEGTDLLDMQAKHCCTDNVADWIKVAEYWMPRARDAWDLEYVQALVGEMRRLITRDWSSLPAR
jgi:hypothetical protein